MQQREYLAATLRSFAVVFSPPPRLELTSLACPINCLSSVLDDAENPDDIFFRHSQLLDSENCWNKIVVVRIFRARVDPLHNVNDFRAIRFEGQSLGSLALLRRRSLLNRFSFGHGVCS